MSDFLNSLIARSIPTPAEAAEGSALPRLLVPRLASRFEHPLADLPELLEKDVESGSSLESGPAQFTTEYRYRGETDHRRMAQTIRPGTAASEYPSGIRDDFGREELLARPEARPDSVRSLPADLTQELVVVDRDADRGEAAIFPRISRLDREQAEQDGPTLAARPEVMLPPANRDTLPGRRKGSQPDTGRFDPGETALTGEQPPGSAARGGAPVVKVTIGRVDVRAVVQPKPPAPARQPAQGSKISLDDYLKQRSEGKR